MKFSVRSLLKDKNVLRIVSLISVLNLMGYIMVRDLESVSFFVLVGFLATHFSKNMIIVLLVSIISTNFLTMSKKARTVYEGMTGKNSKKSKSKEKSKNAEDDEEKEDGKEEDVEDADEELDENEATGKAGNVDYASTIEAAYDNIETHAGTAGIKKMANKTEDLAGLMKQQESLIAGIETMEPMIERVTSLIDKVTSLAGGQSK
jgi:hypothetical protein|uniref:Uncharacterized protein n=1 Tax=viral metagenome TaxID=1070528 RepID=A0A6C0JC22_9ZZZZ